MRKEILVSEDSGQQCCSGGMGFLGLLTIAFIVMRLCNVIKWSWLWVLAPAWIPLLIFVAALIAGMIIAVIPTEIKK
mgnify:FL=1